MVKSTFDESYFSTESQEVEREAKTVMRAAVGAPCINNEEFELVDEMTEAVKRLGLDKVGFESTDEDTGETIVLAPSRSAADEEMLRLIHETYGPLIQAARAKGKDRT